MITFHDLYERYAPSVYRFAVWLSGDPVEAEDITSETFIRAWTGKAAIRTETVQAYLFAIARNQYLMGRRKHARQVPIQPTQVDPAPRPDDLVEDRLNLEAVMRTLQALPEIDRTAFLLRVRHELSYKEIARMLGLSLSAAKVKVHRVRLKLAALHEEELTG